MKTISSFVIAVALLFGVMIGTSSIAKADDVDTVKNGVLDMDKSTTLGKAVGGYDFFTNVKWQSGEDKQGRKFVFFDAEFNDKALNSANKFEITFNRGGENTTAKNIIYVEGAGTGDGMLQSYMLMFHMDRPEEAKGLGCFKSYVTSNKIKFTKITYHKQFVLTSDGGFKPGDSVMSFYNGLLGDDSTPIVQYKNREMLSLIYKNEVPDFNDVVIHILRDILFKDCMGIKR